MQVSRVLFWTLGIMAVRKIPPTKAPRWPRQSTCKATSLNSSRKAESSITMKIILNLKMNPILEKAGQLMMIYPKLSPIIPYKLVDEPTFSMRPVDRILLKISPAIPDRIYTMKTQTFPNVYSNRLTSRTKMKKLHIKCSILACKNCAATNLQTCPAYTIRESLRPISINVSVFTYSTDELESKPIINSAMKMPVLSTISKVVRDCSRTEGQKVFFSMMKQLSSFGSITATFPERKRILCYQIQAIFYWVIPTRNMLSTEGSLALRREAPFWLALGSRLPQGLGQTSRRLSLG